MQIYKILRPHEWSGLQSDGQTAGAPVDIADGYVHLSTASQLPVTLDKHFADDTTVMVLTCEVTPFGDDLRWEPSRGGDLFPHLYRELRLADIVTSKELSRGASGFAVDLS